MKIEFIKRGAATRLILIFAGWSTDTRYYSDCTVEDWDTAVVSDYRDMEMPAIPEQYKTLYIFAYSLGVAAAAASRVPAAARIGICGSLVPASDRFGIPSSIYQGTLDGLNEKTLSRFHLRMAGDRKRYAEIIKSLPSSPDIEALKEELDYVRRLSQSELMDSDVRFDRVYLAEDDKIFPYKNLTSFWQQRDETTVVIKRGPHAVDLASIINECIPDAAGIGEGFQRAGISYIEHALVQSEICRRLVERLSELLPSDKRTGGSMLEIGPGQGLLTEEWRKLLHPRSATYVDLAEVPYFGIAEKETYLRLDAEEWLEHTSETFDVILSASTIQWFANPIRFISTVREHLNPGGIALVSTFVKGNLHQLDSLRPSPIFYHTADEYALDSAEILDEWKRTLTFKSSRDMMMHLRLTGVSPRRRKSVSTIAGKDKGEKQKTYASLPLELTYCPLILFIKSDTPLV